MEFYQIMHIVINEQPTFPELWEEFRNPTTPLSAHFTFIYTILCWPYEQYISKEYVRPVRCDFPWLSPKLSCVRMHGLQDYIPKRRWLWIVSSHCSNSIQ
jgi:uncharacterized protein (UPF0305 family)